MSIFLKPFGRDFLTIAVNCAKDPRKDLERQFFDMSLNPETPCADFRLGESTEVFGGDLESHRCSIE